MSKTNKEPKFIFKKSKMTKRKTNKQRKQKQILNSKINFDFHGTYLTYDESLGAAAVERSPHKRKVRCSNPSRDRPNS